MTGSELFRKIYIKGLELYRVRSYSSLHKDKLIISSRLHRNSAMEEYSKFSIKKSRSDQASTLRVLYGADERYISPTPTVVYIWSDWISHESWLLHKIEKKMPLKGIALRMSLILWPASVKAEHGLEKFDFANMYSWFYALHLLLGFHINPFGSIKYQPTWSPPLPKERSIGRFKSVILRQLSQCNLLISGLPQKFQGLVITIPLSSPHQKHTSIYESPIV